MNKDPEKARDQKRLWKKNNKPKVNAQARRDYWRSPDKYRKRSRDYAQSHPEQIRASKKRWDKENKENRKAYLDKTRERVNEVARASRLRNLEKCKERLRLWRAVNREKIQDYQRRRAVECAEKLAEYRRKRWQNNKERTSAQSKEWRRKNPEKLREYSRRRIVKNFESDGTVTTAGVRALWDRQHGKCAYFAICGNPLGARDGRNMHRDHIEPLVPKDKSRGPGKHSIDNIQLLCKSCNSKKRNKDPYAFTQAHEGRLFPDLPRDPKKR